MIWSFRPCIFLSPAINNKKERGLEAPRSEKGMLIEWLHKALSGAKRFSKAIKIGKVKAKESPAPACDFMRARYPLPRKVEENKKKALA